VSRDRAEVLDIHGAHVDGAEKIRELRKHMEREGYVREGFDFTSGVPARSMEKRASTGLILSANQVPSEQRGDAMEALPYPQTWGVHPENNTTRAAERRHQPENTSE